MYFCARKLHMDWWVCLEYTHLSVEKLNKLTLKDIDKYYRQCILKLEV